MRHYRGKKYRARSRSHYCLVINSHACGYSRERIARLINAVTGAGASYHVIESDILKEVSFRIKRCLPKSPTGVIACGGDTTVNLVARHLIRRTCALGIYPLGRFNNIYRSLYGKPDYQQATHHILSGESRRIDQGLISGKFFLGSVGLGLIPEMYELIHKKRIPRFGIGWSRLAASAAAAVRSRKLSLKVDAFGFDVAPLTLNINLLPYTLGLSLVPACIDDDGKCEVTFDSGRGQAIFSGYIRQIFKGKYTYADDIRMYRGTKIAINPVTAGKIYLDGELLDPPDEEVKIEIFPKRIRVFHSPEE
ncbi:MAG: hypothetical protein JSV44_03320 [Candidatus Zixiibacteriota bacterium]|nr:MAG: hypothetical protein JSV44_03320 [candidate division Zixibacteria bacterium]